MLHLIVNYWIFVIFFTIRIVNCLYAEIYYSRALYTSVTFQFKTYLFIMLDDINWQNNKWSKIYVNGMKTHFANLHHLQNYVCYHIACYKATIRFCRISQRNCLFRLIKNDFNIQSTRNRKYEIFKYQSPGI